MFSVKDLIGTLVLNHKDLEAKNSGFAHLANVGELEADQPFTLCEGVTIRRANEKEVSTIQMLLALTAPSTSILPEPNPYEMQSQGVDERRTQWVNLPKPKWRYHVVAYECRQPRLHSVVFNPVRLLVGLSHSVVHSLTLSSQRLRRVAYKQDPVPQPDVTR